MNKSTIGAIAAGIGISAVAMGVIGAQKMNQKHRMAHRVMALKNEFASDAGIMNKMAR